MPHSCSLWLLCMHAEPRSCCTPHADLEALRQAEHTAAGEPHRAVMPSDKRYLILTSRVSEADCAHYPLPLACMHADPAELAQLRAIVRKLRGELDMARRVRMQPDMAHRPMQARSWQGAADICMPCCKGGAKVYSSPEASTALAPGTTALELCLHSHR